MQIDRISLEIAVDCSVLGDCSIIGLITGKLLDLDGGDRSKHNLLRPAQAILKPYNLKNLRDVELFYRNLQQLEELIHRGPERGADWTWTISIQGNDPTPPAPLRAPWPGT